MGVLNMRNVPDDLLQRLRIAHASQTPRMGFHEFCIAMIEAGLNGSEETKQWKRYAADVEAALRASGHPHLAQIATPTLDEADAVAAVSNEIVIT